MLPFPSEQPGDDTEAHFTYVRALRILSVDCSSGDRVVVLLRPGWGSTFQKEKEKRKEEKRRKEKEKRKEEKRRKEKEKRRGEKLRKCKISEERRREDERREERERLEARKKKEERKEKSKIEIRTAGILKEIEKKIWIKE